MFVNNDDTQHAPASSVFILRYFPKQLEEALIVSAKSHGPYLCNKVGIGNRTAHFSASGQDVFGFMFGVIPLRLGKSIII